MCSVLLLPEVPLEEGSFQLPVHMNVASRIRTAIAGTLQASANFSHLLKCVCSQCVSHVSVCSCAGCNPRVSESADVELPLDLDEITGACGTGALVHVMLLAVAFQPLL